MVYQKGFLGLGCNVKETHTQWGIYAPHAKAMILKIYKNRWIGESECEIYLERGKDTTGHIFHTEMKNSTLARYYTWQMVKEDGSISDFLVDPYAKGVSFDLEREVRNQIIRLQKMPIKRPNIPWEETIIYELHVGHFTKSKTSGVEEKKRGTFLGLIEKLPYLKSLGVTTIELQPVFTWNRHTIINRHPQTGELLKDEWGYNTICFFALDDTFAVEKEKVHLEFMLLVETAHQLGLEIILDVVYNHTGEGGEHGKTFHFKELADEVYYKKRDGKYLNCGGTGNVLNATHIVVKELIMDSLRYWSSVYGIDGYRFDLAPILQQDEHGNWANNGLLTDIANDPILSSVKLISESWDAKGNYDFGRMPGRFKEWSDYYRDTMRKVVKGDQGEIRNLATCLVGEEMRGRNYQKGSESVVHFITAHDGFTMFDLMSYNAKHNQLNGEGNRDGHNGNYSDNCGVEGETSDQAIIDKRLQRIKNFFALMFLSKGTPMLLMGDEMGRTQQGNNNAFCQNNELTWVDWERAKDYSLLATFVSSLIQLRNATGFSSKTIFKWHGIGCNVPDWSYHSKSLAWEVVEGDQKLYVIWNNYEEELTFKFPPSENGWQPIIDTACHQSIIQDGIVSRGEVCVLPHSLNVFKAYKKEKTGS